MNRIAMTAALLVFSASACANAQHSHDFQAMQERGRAVMGVDQYTSVHVFQDLADGGRIELQRDSAHTDGVEEIRTHLQAIAAAFRAGDFSAPTLVHMQSVPGAATMAEKKAVITYVYRELPRGGEVRIYSKDKSAVNAIHSFLAFQRSEHHVD